MEYGNWEYGYLDTYMAAHNNNNNTNTTVEKEKLNTRAPALFEVRFCDTASAPVTVASILRP